MLTAYAAFLYQVINRIYLNSLKAGAVDHFDDLLLGHFYFALVGVAVGEFAAVGDGPTTKSR